MLLKSVLTLITVWPSLGSYDADVAYTSMVLSSMAYCPTYKLQDLSFNTGCSSDVEGLTEMEVYYSNTYDAQGFVAVLNVTANPLVIASFMGTNGSKQDFADDLSGGEFSFSTCEIEGNKLGNVHDGFCSYYNSLQSKGMADRFAELVALYPTYLPIVTGHSLGAAAAAVMAVDLNARYEISPYLYTFGQPRVGGYSFSESISDATAKAYRVVHKKDMIAHLPPCCAVAYKCYKGDTCPYHTGHEVWYDNNMKDSSDYVECNQGEDTSCSDSLMVALNVDDHLNYFNTELGDYCCY